VTKKPTYDRQCAICSTPFQTKHPLMLTCTYECSGALRQQRRRERYARSKTAREKFLEEASEINQATWDNLRTYEPR
jgi:predicted nucleic acid-binding Zn ribbon protein